MPVLEVTHFREGVITEEAFFSFDWTGSALQKEFNGLDKFVPITYQKDWSVIRKIDEASGVKYTCK